MEHAAKLPVLQSGQCFVATEQHTQPVGTVEFVAGKYVEVAAQRLHVAPANQAHLVIKLHVFGRQRLSQGQHAVAVAMTVVDLGSQSAAADHLENSGVKITPNAPYKLVLTDEKETQRAASYTRNLTTAWFAQRVDERRQRCMSRAAASR